MSLWTKNGVELSGDLDSWYNRVVAFKRKIFGNDYVVDPTTKQGAEIVELSELLYNAEMNNVSAMAQLSPDTATGICLDWIGSIKGVFRNAGFPQQIKVNITSAITGYTITPNDQFITLDGLYAYAVASSVEITALEQQIILLSANDGNPPVAAGDGLRTVRQFPNITSAIIADGGINAGSETESDESYRRRIKNSEIGFIGTLQLMYSELLTVPGIAKAWFYYNDDATENDAQGRPPGATEFIVVPDDGVDGTSFNNLVAQKIVETKVPGAPTFGNITVHLDDYLGEPKDINFSRGEKVSIEFAAKIGVSDSTNQLSIDNVPLQQQQIRDYVNQLRLGANVEWSRILGFIANDNGYRIVNWGLRVKGSSTWTQADISVLYNQYAWVDSTDDITISTGDLPE